MAAVCPSTGPRGGETRVVISGSELKHGADPYCRFPVDGGAPPGSFWGGGGGGGGVHVTAAWSADQAAVVAASRGTGADGRPALVCVAPLSAAASAAALEVSLNGQDFSSDLVHYGFVDPPAPAPLSNPKPRPRPNPKPRPRPLTLSLALTLAAALTLPRHRPRSHPRAAPPAAAPPST